MKTRSHYKYLILLTTLFITCYLLTAVVQNRLVGFHHIFLTGAIFIYPISYLLSDIVTEVYGYKFSRQMIWCGIISWIIMALFLEFIMKLKVPHFWKTYDNDFSVIFAPILRDVLAGSIAVMAGQFLNIYAISKLKILTKGRYFWIRSVSSSLVGNFLTNFIALFFIFFGRTSTHSTFEIMIYDILMDIIYTGALALPAVFFAAFLKRAEGIDAYDLNINFNPFKFDLNQEKSNDHD